MPTKLEIITSALQLIGSYAPGEAISAEDAQVCGTDFDGFVDRLNSQRLAIFSEKIEEFTLAPGQQTRTYGVSGNFNAARPQQILWANLIFSPGTPQEVRRPLSIWDYQKWANYRYLAAQGPPNGFYSDDNYPQSTLYFYPIPDQAYGVEFFVWRPLTVGADLTDNVVVPPGYWDLLIYNLAKRFCGIFDRPIPPLVQEQAQKSYMEVLGQNAPSPDIATDVEILSRRGGLYNWLTGQIE